MARGDSYIRSAAKLSSIFLIAAALSGAANSAEAQITGPDIRLPASVSQRDSLIDMSVTDKAVLGNIRELRRQFPEKKDCFYFVQDMAGHIIPPWETCSKGGRTLIAVPPGSENGRFFRDYFLIDYFLEKNEAAEEFLPPPRVPSQSAYNNNIYWQHFVFDHEAGHAHFHDMKLQEGSFAETYQDETFADLYALIRHYQRFGTRTGFDEALMMARGRLIGFMDDFYGLGHMSSLSLLHLIKTENKSALARLTPQKTVDLAAHVVSRNILMREHLHKLFEITSDEKNKILSDSSRTVSATRYPLAVAGRILGENLPRELALIWLASVRSLHNFGSRDSAMLKAAYDAISRWPDVRPDATGTSADPRHYHQP